jgi:hypothetical protein
MAAQRQIFLLDLRDIQCVLCVLYSSLLITACSSGKGIVVTDISSVLSFRDTIYIDV